MDFGELSLDVFVLIAGLAMFVWGWRLWSNDHGAADRLFESSQQRWEAFRYGLRPSLQGARATGALVAFLGLAVILGGLDRVMGV